MGSIAIEAVNELQREFAPEVGANRVVADIASGRAPRRLLSAIAAEQHHVIGSDLRSFQQLANRSSAEPATRTFFESLVHGEKLAAQELGRFVAACGVGETELRAYETLPGCQAYPSFVAWLAVNAEPTSAVLALVANFAEWGGYCRTISEGLRKHYGFSDEACGFFDFFAAPSLELSDQAIAAIQAGIDAGRPPTQARRYARLLRSYESMFWDTLAASMSVA